MICHGPSLTSKWSTVGMFSSSGKELLSAFKIRTYHMHTLTCDIPPGMGRLYCGPDDVMVISKASCNWRWFINGSSMTWLVASDLSTQLKLAIDASPRVEYVCKHLKIFNVFSSSPFLRYQCWLLRLSLFSDCSTVGLGPFEIFQGLGTRVSRILHGLYPFNSWCEGWAIISIPLLSP